jgi:uncharacterized tellurite resistance protein B-like protein
MYTLTMATPLARRCTDSQESRMIKTLKAFFSQPAEEAVDDARSLHLAAAALLVQVAKSDHALEDLELDRVRRVLQREWSVDDDELAELVALADDTTDESVSLHTQVDLINRNFEPTQKVALVRGLWEVACADGEIHRYEELLVRRLADLIYVPHADFIRTKHDALGTR